MVPVLGAGSPWTPQQPRDGQCCCLPEEFAEVQSGHDGPGPGATDWWRQILTRVSAVGNSGAGVRLPLYTRHLIS